ncbi:colanic acid biosynthesis protein [compost metagenome]
MSNVLLIQGAIKESVEIHLYCDHLDKEKDGLEKLQELAKSKITYHHVSMRNIPQQIMKSPRKLIRTFSEYKYVVDISAGDSFSDIYGYKRFLNQAFYKYLAIRNSKLILAPQTIGPFSNNVVRKISDYIISKCFYSFSRDPVSTQFLKTASPHGNYFETTDVAFCLPFQKQPNGESTKIIGINISGLLARGGYNGKNQFNLKCDYLTTLKKLIVRLKDDGYTIVLVPHVISSSMGGMEDDASYSRSLVKELSIDIAPSFKNPIEAKNFISSLHLFIGSRMHATIAALSSATPVIPLAYSMKFASLFSGLEYKHTIDLKTLNTDEIIAEILGKLENIDILKRDAESSAVIATKRLENYKTKLEQILQ